VPVNGLGIAHVCYQANDKTRAYQKFLDSGSSTIGNPDMVRLNPKSPVEYAYVRDNDGIMLEIEHVDVSKLQLPEPPKNNYRIRHVSLATSDMNRIVKFYSVLLEEPNPRRAGKYFGLSSDKLDQVSGLPKSKIKMSWFQVRNLELEIIEYLSHPPEVPAEPRPLNALGYNMIVFDVKDIDKARTLFELAGGKIVGDIEPILGGNIIFGRDPDGNLIGLQKVAATSVVSSKNFSDNGI
jgi:catechol 2,3-dioxygenase-like lactoylglutathione lyase family enzyme